MAAVASECVAPALRLGARAWTGAPSGAATWRRGLLLGADHLGDVLYRTASLRALAEALPGCTWDWALEGGAADLVARHPVIRETIPAGDLARRAGGWDVALCYDSSSYGRALVTAVRLGIPNRMTYAHRGLSGLVTWAFAAPRRESYPAIFARAVAELGGGAWIESGLRPEVVTDARDEAEAEEFARGHGLPEAGGWCAAFLTTRQTSGVWPARFLADALALVEREEPGRPTILLGAAGDEEVLRAEKRRAGLRAGVAAGRIGVRALVCLLRRAAVVLSTDSGPRHLANAAGTPVVFFRNLSFGAAEAGRYAATEWDLAPADLEYVEPGRQEAAFARVRPEQAAEVVRERLAAVA